MTDNIANTSEIQQQILSFIKQEGEVTNAQIAVHLDVSYEAVRQQLRHLQASQLVIAQKKRAADRRSGRPTTYYALSPTGDHLFPKAYDELAVNLIDTLAAALGPDALRQVLATFTENNVQRWSSSLQGKSLTERLEALKSIYLEDDAHMEVAETNGELRLVERNCPFLNVATRRPKLCSVTVSTLNRLLGYRVTREQRFQDGDGRCVFRVHLDQPIDPDTFRFAFEDELPSLK